MDLDFLFLEYDRGKAVAIVEYKHERAARQFPTHPTYQAMIDLGDRAALPVFGVRYADDYSWWRVTALNGAAKKWVPSPVQMDEHVWVTLLYRLRGYDLPESVFVDAEVAL